MFDMQSQPDARNIEIDRVGIKDIVYPIVLKDKANGSQNTNATISLSVRLPHDFKGTHMSRFVEVINRHRHDISISSLRDLLEDTRGLLQAEEAHIELTFKYFVEKTAPVSKQSSLMDYDCVFAASLNEKGYDMAVTVYVPVLSLCPCSKEISRYGAHNQRSIMKISVRAEKLIWIEELIEYAEASASSPIYALLKREDEKYVTEKSYENPVFVEDIVRNATELLMADSRVLWFKISSTNMESIHNHNAWAMVERDKR